MEEQIQKRKKIFGQRRRRRTGRKRNKYLDKENIWSTEKKKNEEGKGGKHLEKEMIG